VLGEILVGLRAAGFEQSDFQSGFREAFAGPAAGSAGTHNGHIVKVVLSLKHSVSAHRMLTSQAQRVN